MIFGYKEATNLRVLAYLDVHPSMGDPVGIELHLATDFDANLEFETVYGGVSSANCVTFYGGRQSIEM